MFKPCFCLLCNRGTRDAQPYGARGSWPTLPCHPPVWPALSILVSRSCFHVFRFFCLVLPFLAFPCLLSSLLAVLACQRLRWWYELYECHRWLIDWFINQSAYSWRFLFFFSSSSFAFVFCLFCFFTYSWLCMRKPGKSRKWQFRITPIYRCRLCAILC